MMNSQHCTSTNVVRNEHLLERRIKYYIESGRGGRQTATALIQALSKQARLYVFGGLIRDISLFTAHRFRSDIDLVFAGSKTQLHEILFQQGLKQICENKFGGFRVHDFTIDIDIWSLEDTWAFKHNYINADNVESLLDTTLMTWDSVLYDIGNNRIITTESWLDDLRSGRLDLVLEHTPDIHNALVKILRTIYSKDVLLLGERLSQFLLTTLAGISDKTLTCYEAERYSTHYINTTRLCKLRQSLSCWSGSGDIPVNPHLHFKQLVLKLD